MGRREKADLYNSIEVRFRFRFLPGLEQANMTNTGIGVHATDYLRNSNFGIRFYYWNIVMMKQGNTRHAEINQQ